jgi:hypothetical protein
MGIKLGDFTAAFQHDSKGAGGTRAKAAQVFKSLQSFGKTAKWGDTTPCNLTSKQVAGYIRHRATTISARSVQNEAAIIRRAVKGAQRELGDLSDKSNNWGNSRLGVPSGTRTGGTGVAKAPIDGAKFAAAREKLSTEMKVVVDLQRSLGLRRQEAVKATNTKEWQTSLTAAQAQDRGVYLSLSGDAGSKGGRPRHIYVPPGRTGAVLQAVSAVVAAKASSGNGQILGQYDDLKSAVKGYTNALAYVELNGSDSGHGLRREFACLQYDHYISEGLDKDTALARLSQDLGHGDGRGRWVENNYLSGRK